MCLFNDHLCLYLYKCYLKQEEKSKRISERLKVKLKDWWIYPPTGWEFVPRKQNLTEMQGLERMMMKAPTIVIIKWEGEWVERMQNPSGPDIKRPNGHSSWKCEAINGKRPSIYILKRVHPFSESTKQFLKIFPHRALQPESKATFE